MADKTPNHKLNTYQPGDENWTHTSDMETIERRLVIRDSENNLEDYEAHEAAIFIATDTGAVFDGNGEEWNRSSRKYDEIRSTKIINERIDAPLEGHLVESFDRGDLEYYSGDTHVFEIINGDIAGEYLLKYDRSGQEHETHLLWTDNVETRRGEGYATHIRLEEDNSTAVGPIICGQVQGGELIGGYSAAIFAGNNQFWLIKEPTDEDEEWIGLLDRTAVTIEEDTLYRIEFDLGFSRLEARLVDESGDIIATVSESDTEFDTGVFGYRARSSDATITEFDWVTRSALYTFGDRQTTNRGSNGGIEGSSHNWAVITEDPYNADPTGSEDSLSAIQQAFDDGGTVFIPSGTYLLSDELEITSQHTNLTVVGEGYDSELRGDAGFDGAALIRYQNNETIYNTTVKNLRLNGNDEASRCVFMQFEDDGGGHIFDTIFAHQAASGSALMDGHPDTIWNNIRVWDTADSGLDCRGPDPADSSDLAWTIINNIVAWNCGSNGISLSKQNCLLNNFISRENNCGMKVSAESYGILIKNGWLIDNHGQGDNAPDPGNGFATTGSPMAAHMGDIDGVFSIGNAHRGFNFSSGSRWMCGSLYAGDNAEEGVYVSTDRVNIDRLVAENNGGSEVFVASADGGEVDIWSYRGDDDVDSDAWVGRSPDTSSEL